MSWRIPLKSDLPLKVGDNEDLRYSTYSFYFEIDFRRHYDQILCRLVWQYKPFPGANWETYFTVTMGMLVSNPSMSKSIMSAIYNTQASQVLSTRRFYKVERVDEKSESPAKTGPNASGPIRAQLGRGSGE